ncbi:MAG TPA: hypothetical protein VFU74_23775 [Actinocrinis sp.]|nr:hypothetical protein [Actinocrinis sp.]
MRARTSRWVAAAALLAGIALTTGTATNAQADGGGPGGFWIATHVELSGSVWQGGGSPYAPVGWTPPKCWLELNSGYGVDPAYTPDGFAAYMAQVYAFYLHAQEDSIRNAFYAIYHEGQGVDAAVGLTNPPYNQGVGGGKWYAIACTPDAGYGDYAAVQASLGVANQYEEWFWLRDGAPPAGVPVIDPELLAEYAAANTKVTPGWPNFSPALNAVQTVNLPTLITNAAGTNGFKEYIAVATLPGILSSKVRADPESVTFTSSGPMSPSSVTCTFDAAGNMQPCQLTFLKSTPPDTSYTITESSMWKVTWDGDPGAGEPGWTRQIGPVVLPAVPVTVQEIQSIVGH